MKKYKVGDKVKLSETGRYASQIRFSNGDVGTIIQILNRYSHNYQVLFPNIYHNYYGAQDLEGQNIEVKNWKEKMKRI